MVIFDKKGQIMKSLYPIFQRIKSLAGIARKENSSTQQMEYAPMNIQFSESGLDIVVPGPVVALAHQAVSKMMDASELIYLAAAVQTSQLSSEDIIVEIGTYVGSTAVFLHRTLNESGNTQTSILSVDPFERYTPNDANAQGIYRQYLQNILRFDAGSRCMPLVAFSQDAHPVVPNNIGLLIVDGDHTYEGAKSDLTLYVDKVRSGGLIFLDDYNEQTYPGVYHAFNDFIDHRTDCKVLHKSYFAIAQRI